MNSLIVLAHAGDGGGDPTVFTVMLVSVLALVWIVLGVVVWIFWRANQREDRAKEETEWQSVRSS